MFTLLAYDAVRVKKYLLHQLEFEKMNRRHFVITSALSLTTLASGRTALAQVFKPTAGTHYLPLSKLAPVDVPRGKFELIEFFSYNCTHCNSFEPSFDAWAKQQPKDVVVKRVPVAFADSFVPQQRLFYALEAMGKLDDLHRKVFTAIHGERKNLSTLENMLPWIEKQGLDKAQFSNLYNSFTVTTKGRKAQQLQDAYQVSGTPALGIGGRFYTDGELAGNNDKAMRVADYLISELRKGR